MLENIELSAKKLVDEIKDEMVEEIEILMDNDPMISQRNFFEIATSCPYSYQEICRKWKLYEDDYYHMYEYISDYKATNIIEEKILEEAYSTITEENDLKNPPVLFVLVISRMIKKLLMVEILYINISKMEMKAIEYKIKNIDIFKREHGNI